VRGEEEREYVEFVTARQPGLHRAAYLMCGDQHRADDIVQATMTALYRKWRRAREADNLDAYVHRMLVRAYLAEKRLGWARVRLMSEPPERAATSPPAGVEERDSLRTALARLSKAQRTVLVLRFACDMSVDDVAAALRTSPGNVKSHTSRGLASLRDLLDVRSTVPGRKDALG
jgi:RNA polymerase sigma-70 factor (sigma-E family)